MSTVLPKQAPMGARSSTPKVKNRGLVFAMLDYASAQPRFKVTCLPGAANPHHCIACALLLLACNGWGRAVQGTDRPETLLPGLYTICLLQYEICANFTQVLSRILSLGRKLYKALSRGVWGHAPPEKFRILDPPRLILMHMRGKIIPRTVFFYNFFYLKLGCALA